MLKFLKRTLPYFLGGLFGSSVAQAQTTDFDFAKFKRETQEKIFSQIKQQQSTTGIFADALPTKEDSASVYRITDADGFGSQCKWINLGSVLQHAKEQKKKFISFESSESISGNFVPTDSLENTLKPHQEFMKANGYEDPVYVFLADFFSKKLPFTFNDPTAFAKEIGITDPKTIANIVCFMVAGSIKHLDFRSLKFPAFHEGGHKILKKTFYKGQYIEWQADSIGVENCGAEDALHFFGLDLKNATKSMRVAVSQDSYESFKQGLSKDSSADDVVNKVVRMSATYEDFLLNAAIAESDDGSHGNALERMFNIVLLDLCKNGRKDLRRYLPKPSESMVVK